ncbi:uncharacterized protein LOC143445802 [Clavelina lepadiformis]|uniref:uncharacterized protein LOC143445802 n=1 Tax=Clavelina lepadiformis TaxID=159417 RepID=UPI0040430355
MLPLKKMCSVVLVASVFLQTAVIIQGQYISPLTTPHPIQATNSTVVITATATISSSAISNNETWILSWKLNKTQVAQVGYAPYPNVRGLDEGFNRITVSAISTSASSFTTQLTIAQLKAEEDGYEVQLYGAGVEKQSLNLTIKNCNVSLPYDVIVDATSRIFNSPGTFACSNGGDLFYSNGKTLTSSDTTCLASAEWSGQDNLQCWTAPSVTLNSSSIKGKKLTVVEGNDLNLTCNYNDVIPAGNTSQFYISGENLRRARTNNLSKGDQFILFSLQRNDNNKVVSCQAVTPYTDLYPTSGRSSEYKIDVLYFAKQNTAPTFLWYTNQTGKSNVVFFSNPNSVFVSLTKNGQPVANDESMTINSNPGDKQTFVFSRTQVISSDNGTYTLTVQSSNKDIFPDHVQIIFHIIVADGPPPTPGLSTGAIICIGCGGAVVIICVAVCVICKCRRGSNKKSKDDGLGGNEVSISRDEPIAVQFDVKHKKKGSSEKKEKMNPIYEAGDQPAPIEEAYAEVEKKKKKKGLNEKEERINPLYGSSESPDQVEAAYAEVDKKKKKKKKGSSEKEEKVNPLYVSSDQPEPTEAAYAEVDKNKKKKQSAKEERINPLYETSSSQDQVEAAYAEVDKSKKKRKAFPQVEESSNATYAEVNKPQNKKKPPLPNRANTAGSNEKEEKINPLYGSSESPDQVEAAYAEVDKKKKKKKKGSSAKEERINPLYEASSSQDQVEAAYAEVDKSKKKRKPTAQDATRNEATPNATYAEVNKPKKNKKPPPPSRANTTDATQVEESSNATYAEVNKPKKKKKPPLPSRTNTTGWDATNDDVVLHGWSPTPN